MKKAFLAVVCGLIVVAAAAPGLRAQEPARIIPGVRLGVYTDIGDLFIGGEVLVRIANRIYFNPNVEYVFASDLTYLTFNADAHYDLEHEGSPLLLWVGGGLAVIYANPEGPVGGDTEVGVNGLAGVGLVTNSRLLPYLQAKIVISDNTEFVVALGLRF